MVLNDDLVVFFNFDEFLINGVILQHLEDFADFFGEIIVNVFDSTTLLIYFIFFESILELFWILT